MNKLEVIISYVFVMVLCIYNTSGCLGLDAAKGEIGTLKTSVNNLERERREHVQCKHIELSMV